MGKTHDLLSLSSDVYRVLLIEDDYVDQESIRRVLSVTEQEYDVRVCSRLEDGLTLLRSEPFDALLLDLYLPDSEGHESVRVIADEFPQMPIIVLTGLDAQELPEDLCGLSVEHYLVKGEVTGATIAQTVRAVAQRTVTN